jgi:homoserine O-acetyltransferase
LALQADFPTREAATVEARARVERLMSRDANDVIYQFESSRSYNPWPNLERITAPTMWVNSADDFINPRNLSFPSEAIARMGPNARFRMIEESASTRGHGTHTWAVFWRDDLVALLARSE